MDDCDDRISRLMTSISGRGGRPRADLGVNRTYVGETSEHTRLQQACYYRHTFTLSHNVPGSHR